MTRHSSGQSKKVFDSPCVDCDGGLRMSQLIKKVKAAGKNQNRKSTPYKGNGQSASSNQTSGKKSSWGKKKNSNRNFGSGSNSQNQGNQSSSGKILVSLIYL